MLIQKVYGLIVPASKDEEKEIDIKGLEIQQTQKLFELVKRTFDESESICDIEIKMQETRLPSGNTTQDNEFREHLILLNEEFTLENCKWFGKLLAKITDKTTKDGILFIIKGSDDSCSKIFFCRIPAETGITVENKLHSIKFDVKEDVYVKNSKKYKAAYFYDIIIQIVNCSK